MRFGRQRFLICLGFLLIPFVFFVALTNNPDFSSYTLKVALKIARIRTGLKIDASSWSVNPLSFSAQLNQVLYQHDNLVAEIPSLRVQVSPLGLFLFKFHVYRVDIENPRISGEIPQAWLKSRNSSDEWKRDIPAYLGRSIKEIYLELLQNNIEIEQLNLLSANSALKEIKFTNSDVKAQLLKDGQARMEWQVSHLEVPGKLSNIFNVKGSIALLKESRKTFFLSLRRFEILLSEAGLNSLSATGRMPGTFTARGNLLLKDLNQWLKGGKLSEAYAQHSAVEGAIKLEIDSKLTSSSFREVSGQFSGENLLLDGYKAKSLQGKIDSQNDQSLLLKDIQILFSKSKLDSSHAKNSIHIKRVAISDKKIVGELDVNEMGICALLNSLTVEDCWAAFNFGGNAKFEGTLSPFWVGLEGDFQTSAGRVGSDPLTKPHGDELLFFKPAKIQAGVDIGEKQLDFRKATVSWSEQSRANVTGKIIFKPALVDLNVDAQNIEASEALDTFINLHVSGKIQTRTKIFYSLVIPQEQGRTTVLSSSVVSSLGIEKQILGIASGNVNFQNNQLFIGPVELKNGGGHALISGGIRPHPTLGSFMEVSIDANRIEAKATLPEAKNAFLTGFLTGKAKFQGYLNPTKGGKYLNGPIDAILDNVNLFGIPIQKGKIRARYEDKILFLEEILAEKDKGLGWISGHLHPVGGSKITFKTEALPVRNLGYMHEMERIFIDSMIQLSGFWSPKEGWLVEGDISAGRVAHVNIPSGKLTAKGDGTLIEIKADFSPTVFYYLKASPTQERLSPHEMIIRAKNQGILVGMAYLKGWTGPTDVQTLGDIDFAWTPQKGHLFVDSLVIQGPNGFENAFQDLVRVNRPLRIAWEGNRVTENSGWTDEKLPMTIHGNRGDRDLSVKTKLPMALFDNLLPGSQKIYSGTAEGEATVPMPPYITTVKGKGTLKQAGIQLPGVGRPLQELQGDFILASSRFIVPQGKAKMGSGNVDFRAEYLIDLKKPGVILDATLNRAQILVQEDIPMEVSGDLSMRGDSFPYLLSGRLLLSNGVYSREFNQAPTPTVLQKNAQAKPVVNYNLDLELGSNFEIKNSILSAPLQGRIVMLGNDLEPLITGFFDLNKGTVLAKDNEFQISQARVQLPTEVGQPAQVFLRAFTNIRHLNQVYRIEMNVRGPSNNLAFEFTSDPPLANGDIINLLAFGTLRDSNDTTISNRSSVETAQYEALQALFGQAIGKSINRNTGFDVRVTSSRDLSQKATIPKVTVQRRLSKNITATFGRSLDASKPERNFQVDYKVLNNVNVTGVWESPTPEKSSTGVDLRFKFDVK